MPLHIGVIFLYTLVSCFSVLLSVCLSLFLSLPLSPSRSTHYVQIHFISTIMAKWVSVSFLFYLHTISIFIKYSQNFNPEIAFFQPRYWIFHAIWRISIISSCPCCMVSWSNVLLQTKHIRYEERRPKDIRDDNARPKDPKDDKTYGPFRDW